jgi:hypothetical protein
MNASSKSKMLSDSQLVNPQSLHGAEISRMAKDALEQRIAESADYNLEETIEVSQTKHRLLPEGFEIDSDISDEIRSLCVKRKLPRLEEQISSHRKYVGPIIVFAKKLLWRFMGSQIRNNFRYVEDFNTQIVINQIRSAVRYQELNKSNKIKNT